MSKEDWARETRSTDQKPFDTTRRKLLASLGAGTAMAGCMGGDGDSGAGDDDSNNGEGASSDAGEYQNDRIAPWYPAAGMADEPELAQWNPWNVATESHDWYHAGIQRAVYFTVGPDDPPYPLGVEEVTLTDDALTFDLFDNHTWSPSGTEHTAEDLRLTYYLEEQMNSTVTAYASPDRFDPVEFEVVDEKTFRFNIVEEVNNEIIAKQLLTSQDVFVAPRHIFGEWGERFEDATSDDERDNIREDLANFTWENEDVEFISAYEAPPEVSQNSITFHVRDDDGYPHSDTFDHAALENHVLPEGQTHWDMVANDQSIWAYIWGNPLEDKYQNPPDNMELNMTERLSGTSILFNMEPNRSAAAEYREFRQAIAYALDNVRIGLVMGTAPFNEQMGIWAGPMGPPEKGGVGEAQGQDWEYSNLGYEDWLDFDIIPFDAFDRYGAEPKPDKVEEVLSEAGWSKEDGMWYTPDGELPEVRLKDAERIPGSQEAARHCQEVGLNVQFESISSDQHANIYGDVSTDYDAFRRWNGPQVDYLYLHYLESFAASDTGRGTGPLAEDPIELEVPEYGNTEGDMITANVSELISTLLRSSDEEELAEAEIRLAWVFNQALPQIQLDQQFMALGRSTNGWEWPDWESELLGEQNLFITPAMQQGYPKPVKMDDDPWPRME